MEKNQSLRPFSTVLWPWPSPGPPPMQILESPKKDFAGWTENYKDRILHPVPKAQRKTGFLWATHQADWEKREY